MSYPRLPLRRTLLSVFLAAGLNSAVLAQPPAAAPASQSQGLIRGQVLQASTRQPVAGVRVTVQGMSAGVEATSLDLVSDAGGRFQAAVPAGEFGLTAQADGHD